MPEMLLEIGCEELPASFVRKAHEQLREEVVERLRSLGYTPGEQRSMGTPRRLIVSIADLAPRQDDRTVEARGPSAKAAFEEDGSPSRALVGFCKGQGVDPSEARLEGDYVYVTKLIPGRPTADVLAEVIPDAVRALTFDKTMRWGSHRMRFARPIRWILAAFDGNCVACELEGVVSGLESRGHRFNFPERFTATTLDELLEQLRDRQVMVDEDERCARVREGAVSVSGGRAQVSEELVTENANLTEWPSAVIGSFDAKYLELPEEVLVTVMAKHERFFPVRSKGSEGLTNEFVSIRNGGVDEIVAAGNAWVLNARFNDAKFFFDEDLKHTLDSFLERTEGIVFQAELGTVRERADRLAALAAKVAEHTGASAEEIEFARLAGLYAKADLSTGLVGELDELQGVIGGLYARREGFPEPVCAAIRSQYLPDAHSVPGSPDARTALCLILADQLDKIAGYFGLGLSPSGSSDPYGLRRAAGIAMETALKFSQVRSPGDVPDHCAVDLFGLLEAARSGYPHELASPATIARDVFRQRCETLFPETRPDVLEATLADPDLVFRPGDLQDRILMMTALASDTEFVQAATRTLNIVAAAEKKGIPAVALDESKLRSPEGAALLTAVRRIASLTSLGPELKTLQAPIDAFFESTMVMVDDPDVRDARLAMLREVCEVLLRVGDFSKLVIAG